MKMANRWNSRRPPGAMVTILKDIYAAKQEDIDQVRGLIASAKKRQNNVDEELINIISEETEPFFKGQKSASDVSNVIQNRIQVYVNENR